MLLCFFVEAFIGSPSTEQLHRDIIFEIVNFTIVDIVNCACPWALGTISSCPRLSKVKAAESKAAVKKEDKKDAKDQAASPATVSDEHSITAMLCKNKKRNVADAIA